MPKYLYARKLSSEDVHRRSLLITKDAWKMFPPPGKPIVLKLGEEKFKTIIEAEPCICVPPPHEHYHLPMGDLAARLPWQKGLVVTLRKLDERTFAVK